MTDPPLRRRPTSPGPLDSRPSLDKQLGFRPWACTCSPAAALLAAFEGRDTPLCRVHDKDEIAARELEAKRDEHQAETDRIRDVRDELRAEDEIKRRERAQAARDAEIAERRTGVDPVVLRLADLVGAPDPAAWTPIPGKAQHSSRHEIGIGDDAAILRLVTDALGPGTTVNDGNFPDAA